MQARRAQIGEGSAEDNAANAALKANQRAHRKERIPEISAESVERAQRGEW